MMQKLILHDVKLVHSQPGRGISAHPPIGTGGTLGRLKSRNLSIFQLPVEVLRQASAISRKLYRLLQACPVFCMLLQACGNCCRFLQSCASFCKLLNASANFCKLLHASASFCNLLQACTSLQKHAEACKSLHKLRGGAVFLTLGRPKALQGGY